MLRRRWVLAASEQDAITLAWGSVEAESAGTSMLHANSGVVLFAPEDLWALWSEWGKRNDPQRKRYPRAYDVFWVWYRPDCEPDHKHHVNPGDGKCPSVKVRRSVTEMKLWNTPTGFPPRRDPDCWEALSNGIRCAVCFHGNMRYGHAGNGLCAAHTGEDFNEYVEILYMHCAACSEVVKVTRRDWRLENSVPCPHCPDGGVDLIHARRHANDD